MYESLVLSYCQRTLELRLALLLRLRVTVRFLMLRLALLLRLRLLPPTDR